MNEQAIRFRIGIFVLAGLIGLGVLIILLGGLPYYILPSTTYTVQFDNAQGVAPGTPVKRSGVKIGEVRRVTLDSDTGKVEVLIQIEDGQKLRKGDRPTLMQSVLGGDATIAFLPPKDKKDVDVTPVEAGAVIEGSVQAELTPAATDTLKEIKNALEKLTPGAEKVLARLEQLGPEAQDTMREIRKLGPAADKTGEAIQDTAKKLTPSVEKMLERIDKIVPSIERAFDKIDKLAPVVEKAFDKLDQLAPVVQKAVENLDKNTLPDIRRTADEIQVLARSWNKVGERLDLFMRTNEDKLVKTIERTDEVLKRVNEIFSDDNQKNIRDTLRNVRGASDRFDAIAKNTDELLKDSRSTLKTFNDSLLKVDGLMTDLQKATKPLAERGDSIMKNIDESTDKLNRTLTDVRDLLQSIARGEGTIQKLLADPSLYNNLNQASLGLSRLMPRLDYILHDVEIFADKIARHPESLGIGGVVRPGSGVKESPSPYKVFPAYP